MRNKLELSDDKDKAAAAKKLEGKLFVYIYLSQFFATYACYKEWYTVQDGILYACSNGKFVATDDTLLAVLNECKQVGIYHKDKVYKSTSKEYTYREFKKLLRL